MGKGRDRRRKNKVRQAKSAHLPEVTWADEQLEKPLVREVFEAEQAKEEENDHG